MRPAWLGIDVGTQSVRALAVADDGTVIGRRSRPLTSRREGDRHEQDPHAWIAAVDEACRAVVADVRRTGGFVLRGLAVDATSGTVLLVDNDGRPLTPGIMYDDGRATAEAAAIRALDPPVWRRLSYRIPATWGLPKALRLLHTYGAASGSVRLAHQSDVVNRALVGHPVATDRSHALKTGYDLLGGCWPAEALTQLGLDPAALPQVVAPGTVLGRVCAAASEATGLPGGIPVVAGMTDGCAAQLGAGVLRTGDWNAVLGTTLVVKGVTSRLLRDPSGVVYSHRGPTGAWLPGGASSSGAGAVDAMLGAVDLDELDRRSYGRLDDVGAVAYPLAGIGERFPFVAADAVGFMLGDPDDDTGRYLAMMIGIACILRLCVDVLEHLGAPTGGRWSLTGGGARSRTWRQLTADLLAREVRVPDLAEPALGMAILAAGTGMPLHDAAATMVRTSTTVAPRCAGVEVLHRCYENLVDALVDRGWLNRSTTDDGERSLGRPHDDRHDRGRR